MKLSANTTLSVLTAGTLFGFAGTAISAEIPGANQTIQSLADMIQVYTDENDGVTFEDPQEQELLQLCRNYQTTIENLINPDSEPGASPDPEELKAVTVMLEGISHEEVGALGSGFSDTGQNLQNNVLGRMQYLRSGAGLLASNSVMLGQTGGAAGDDFSRLGVYSNFSFGDGSKDRTRNEAAFDFASQAITFGADYRFSDNLIAGAALGFGMADVDMESTPVSSASSESDSLSLTFYGSLFQENWYMDASLGFAQYEYDNERGFVDAGMGVDQTLTSEPEGDSLTLSIGAGINQQHGEWTGDYALRLERVSASIDGYSESGSSLALDVGEQEVDSLQAILAAQWSKAFSTEHGVLLPMLGVEVHQEFDDETRIVIANYKFDPAKNQFSFTSDDADSTFYLLSAGGSWVMSQGRQLFINLDHLAGLSDVSSNTLTAGFRMEL